MNQNHINYKTAAQILGNPEYLAMSYGGYRGHTRQLQPTISQLKEDLRILAAMGVKILRTYNTHFLHATNLLHAIQEMKKEDASFEMYVMLGAWIDCEFAFTTHPNHDKGYEMFNKAEIERAVFMANRFPEIVKVIAVGNEAMVKWATSYFVQPDVILKWVNHLQGLKAEGKLSKDLWVTSSDNFAAWGGEEQYHNEDLAALVKAVDYISLHTYPMHDSYHNGGSFWGILPEETQYGKAEQTERLMERCMNYSKKQYQLVVDYMHSLGVNKPVHIGETGWASFGTDLYGDDGSKACDQYKEGLFYKKMREWTNQAGISCFYFEAFDEPWKDAGNPGGSENHFGLFSVTGEAKYAVWDLVDQGIFDGLSRGDNAITKSFKGDVKDLLNHVQLPPLREFEPVS